MTPAEGLIIVKFNHDKSTSVVQQDSGLFVPERYVIEEADEDADTAWGVTTDRKAINPQKVEIMSGELAGKKAFVHYGAFEVCKWLDDELALIPEPMVMFLIEPIQCLDGIYLGEEVFGELPKTASGIYLTPQLEEKEGVKIRITHLPNDPLPGVEVGTVVVTIDPFQYDLIYEGRKYIKLAESEIIGVETDGGYRPIGNHLLVEYLPDDDLKERIAENDKRRAQRDYIDKHRFHISEAYARGLDPAYNDLPEPKFCKAAIKDIGDGVQVRRTMDKGLVPIAGILGAGIGDTLIVHRNYGCILPNKQWIINMEAVLGWVVQN